MGFVNFIIELLKDPRAAIAGWIAMGVAPTLGFIFLIVFIETGVVFFPFLPGDSLLFAAGVFAAPDAATGKAALPLFWLLPVVWCAPIIGDQCNYFIGHFFGRRIIQSGKVKALTPERLAKTEGMIEKWGPLAVFLGRFFPFIRTFMPFISGISGMRWSRYRIDTNEYFKEIDGVTALRPAPEGVTLKASKLNITSLTIPLLLEWQPKKRSSEFFLSAGVVGVIKTCSSSKIVYNDASGKKHKEKMDSGMNIRPVTMDFLFQAGWDWIGLYAKYSPIDLFENGKGPKVHPVSIGLQLHL